MNFHLLKNKFLYSVHTSTPLGWSSGLLGLYSLVFTLFKFSNAQSISMIILGGVCIFLLPWVVTIRYRWLPARITIPTPANGDHPLNDKVSLCISSIFEQEGDLLLSYNRNNIVGGLRINEGRKMSLNMMAQFMHKYFPATSEESDQFDWAAFKACYDSPETHIFYQNGENKLEEYDKYKIAPRSICKIHYEKDAELDYRKALDLLPVGSVLALKLPKEADREYAYLIGNTHYEPNQSMSAITDIEELEMCLNTAWRVIALMHPGGHNVCLPFLGKGYSGMSGYAYGILWTIVFTYRKKSSHHHKGVYNYGINLCLPFSVMMRNDLKIRQVASFLTYALRG